MLSAEVNYADCDEISRGSPRLPDWCSSIENSISIIVSLGYLLQVGRASFIFIFRVLSIFFSQPIKLQDSFVSSNPDRTSRYVDFLDFFNVDHHQTTKEIEAPFSMDKDNPLCAKSLKKYQRS